ncbi:phosphonate ABC transporter ATP-binding protein [uncultured Hyphomonas sp.]|uniref:phosphonate ABC transporter ATP-binding protein n=1 Tax=uncultured Hyphomonas sp. TaxID=225298 RepID=UPI002AAB626D|nr:phosphonate ABC transporter ATP-binding protein [uncultured Hyphomonas sp.]
MSAVRSSEHSTRAVLSVTAASKSFQNGPTVLEDVSFTIEPGSFCVLLGASGSGKTTLLRSVIGLVPLDGGRIDVAGKLLAPKSLRQLRREIGMVHQDFGLSQRLTAAQNVMAGTAAGLPVWRLMFQAYPKAIQDRACELLEQVGLEEGHVNRPASGLSGGQKQRVGIARALIGNPQLILADEPVASLDPQTAQDVMSLLRQTAKAQGAAVLCSLHQINLSRAYADRIIGLREGRIVFDGPPGQLSQDMLARIFGTGREAFAPSAAVA